MQRLALLLSVMTVLVGGSTASSDWLSASPCALSDDGSRLVAIGDVHGNLDGLEAMLQEAGLRDENGNWIGEDSVLIHTGDLLDRGPDDRGVLELLMDLEGQARKAGGRIEVLLGNHEVMNLYGDLRYVAPESFAQFADKKSEKRREKASKDHLRFLKTKAKFLDQEFERSDGPPDDWFARLPLGYLEHREAFSPSGKYGKWLRRKSAVRQEAGYLFLHGGIEPSLPADIEKLNGIIAREIENYDKIRNYLDGENLIPWYADFAEALTLANTYAKHLKAKQEESFLNSAEEQLLPVLEAIASAPSWLSVHPDGPLWYRGFAKWDEEDGAEKIAELAERFSVCGFVVGHTPQLEDGIETRFGGKVFLIDTGMLASYYTGGTPSALQIDATGVTALYPGAGRVDLTVGYQNTP